MFSYLNANSSWSKSHMLPVEQEACFSTHVSNYPDVACFHLDCFAIKSPFQTCATCDLWLTHTLNPKMEPDNGSRLHNIPTYVPISWLYVIKNICNYIPHPYHAICFTFVLAKKNAFYPSFPIPWLMTQSNMATWEVSHQNLPSYHQPPFTLW